MVSDLFTTFIAEFEEITKDLIGFYNFNNNFVLSNKYFPILIKQDKFFLFG